MNGVVEESGGKDRLRLRAISVSQGGYHFFVFKIPAKILLNLATVKRREDDPLSGIQRTLNHDRLAEIAGEIQAGTAAFPNSLVVKLPDDIAYDEDGGVLEIPNRANSILIIDGQHRLWAFSQEYSAPDMDLAVSGMTDLDMGGAATIFEMINGTQRKINPSLVYDLFPMLRNKNMFAYEEVRAQSLVGILYSDAKSPWKDHIAMLGGRAELITQASFVTNIRFLFKKDGPFNWPGMQDESVQRDLLFVFFRAVQRNFKHAWMNQEYFLCKNTGVGAMLRLMSRILSMGRSQGIQPADERGLAVDETAFVKYLGAIGENEFFGKVNQEYLGEAGIRRFAERLYSLTGLG